MRYSFERGVCYDETAHRDLDFEKTVDELEKYRELVKRIKSSFQDRDLDDFADFIDRIEV